MDARRILSLARRIVTQCLRDKRTFGLIIIVPSIVMALLGYFYTVSPTSGIILGVVNDDAGLGGVSISDKVIEELRAQDDFTIVTLTRADVDAAIKNKSVDGAILFGDTFTSDIVLTKSISLDVVAEGVDRGKYMAINMGCNNATMAAVAKVSGQKTSVNVNSSTIYADGYGVLDMFAPYLLGIIAFVFVFIFTTVTFLRERSFGTFERLLVSPLSRAEIIMGYMLGFSVFAIIQSAIILLFALFVLNVKIAGDVWAVVLIQLLLTIASVNLGIFCSSFAKNELQAVQFIPLLVLPQVFLDGMFWAIATLPWYLQAVSYVLPLTYANDALQNIMIRGAGIGDVWVDVVVLLVFAVAFIGLSTLSLKKSVQ